MAFGSFDDPDAGEAMSDINMTPLIDVMLVLLVIFIITAPLITGSLKLDLPKVHAQASPTPPKALNIGLKQDGALFLDDKPIAEPALLARLAAIGKSAPDTDVRISADTATPYGKVAQIMGAAQNAGLSHIGLVTQPPAGAASGTSP